MKIDHRKSHRHSETAAAATTTKKTNNHKLYWLTLLNESNKESTMHDMDQNSRVEKIILCKFWWFNRMIFPNFYIKFAFILRFWLEFSVIQFCAKKSSLHWFRLCMNRNLIDILQTDDFSRCNMVGQRMVRMIVVQILR